MPDPLDTHFADLRLDPGPFDLIGDIHGCAGEAEALLAKLGYSIACEGREGLRSYTVTHPENRRVIFLGDLVDRGPRSPDVLRLVRSMTLAGMAYCVLGNHDFKLKRWLEGRDVKISHGLESTVLQFQTQPTGFAQDIQAFLGSLPTHIVFDGGQLVVAHAGLREDLHNTSSGKERSFAMYGDTTGERDSYGLPIRLDWAAEYSGMAAVVYGHMAVFDAVWVNNTICVDTGCVFGGRLTALRWPERELVSVKAFETYFESMPPRF
jgi:protein phosphatase